MSKGKFFTREWMAIIFIIVLVVVLQFLAVRAVYLKDKYMIDRELYGSVRCQVEDWNRRKSMKADGKIRGVTFQDGGRELLLFLDSTSYSFRLDSKKSVEDIYLRIACDLNISQPMTLQTLDSVLSQNLHGRLGKLVIAFRRVDSTGGVLESFSRAEHLFEHMNKAGRINLGFISGESIDVFYSLPKGFWQRYTWLVVGIFGAGVSVAGLAITYVFAYKRQSTRRKRQIKWIGDDLHSLKTPVKQIMGIMQWFELKCPDVFKTPEGTKKRGCAMTCLNKILQDMEEGMVTCSILCKTKLKLNNINLELLLSDLIEEQKDANEEKKEVSIKLDYRLPEVVYSSAEALTIIIRNLLDNAVKYSEGKAWVEVCGYQERDNMVIEVADRGIGISACDQEKIFDEYYRVEENDRKGSGRGLPYVSEVVKKMRGRIEVESEPGKGSCFKIYMPIWKENDGK